MNLARIVYRSIAAPDFDASIHIDSITDVSRHKNIQMGITGALAYNDGKFVQVLEGSTESLDDLMTRIRADKRHDFINMVGHWSIEARMFAGWSMAFTSLSRESATVQRRFQCDGLGVELVSLLYNALSTPVVLL